MEQDRVKFDSFVKRTMQKVSIIDTRESPATLNEYPTSKKTLFEYYFNKEKKVWIAWEWVVPSYIHNTSLTFEDHFVPTAFTIQTEYILGLFSKVILKLYECDEKLLDFCVILGKLSSPRYW